ncbi:hypothetical protein P8452_16997 [Trifolium repens]|nr:hypothetical protein P8452_16997 [Trifolium repens]
MMEVLTDLDSSGGTTEVERFHVPEFLFLHARNKGSRNSRRPCFIDHHRQAFMLSNSDRQQQEGGRRLSRRGVDGGDTIAGRRQQQGGRRLPWCGEEAVSECCVRRDEGYDRMGYDVGGQSGTALKRFDRTSGRNMGEEKDSVTKVAEERERQSGAQKSGGPVKVDVAIPAQEARPKANVGTEVGFNVTPTMEGVAPSDSIRVGNDKCSKVVKSHIYFKHLLTYFEMKKMKKKPS